MLIRLLSLVALEFVSVSAQNAGTGCIANTSNMKYVTSSPAMSSLACTNACRAQNFAVAATQWEDCFCGNVMPAFSDYVESSQCSRSCPGYPAENCGGQSAFNVYYIEGQQTSAAPASSNQASSAAGPPSSSALTPASSSTLPASSSQSSSSSSSSTTSSSSSSSSSSTKTSSTTSSSSKSTSKSSISSTSSSSKTSLSSSSFSSSTTSSESRKASTETATATVTHTNTPTATPKEHKKKEKSSGLSTGAIIGIVVGVLAGIGVLAVVIAFAILRHRRHDDDFYSPHSSPSGMKDTGFHGGYNASYPVIDQRLNPVMLGGDHRISIASLADARDYSRQILQVVNPDEKT